LKYKVGSAVPENSDEVEEVQRSEVAKRFQEVYDLPLSEAIIGINTHDLSIDFEVFEWSGEMIKPPEGNFYTSIMRGSGVGGNLREFRHLWIRDEGYLYYPNLSLFAALETFLKKYFDMD
jgi:hypothetical protein